VPPAVIRARILILVVVIVGLAVIAVALARNFTASSVSVTGREAGVPTALSLSTTFNPSTHGELTAVELDLARGFYFDPRSAGVCTDAQAHAGRCPGTSTVGRGEGTIVVEGQYLPRTTYAVGATFYLAAPRHAGDVAGLVLDLYETESKLHATMLGRVVPLRHGRYGLALRFSNTDKELPSGYNLSLLGLTTLLKAERTVAGKAHRVTYNLLTNPNSCTKQGWPIQLLIDSAGQPQIYDSNASCSSKPKPTPTP
jgi:hypothetical protein